MMENLKHLALLRVAVGCAAALLMAVLPRRWRTLWTGCLIGLAGTIVVTGHPLGYVVVAAGCYGLGQLIHAQPETRRWPLACGLMIGFTLLFVVGRILKLNEASFSVQGLTFVPYYLNIYLYLGLLTFLWEVGSGKIVVPTPLAYAFWVFLPFTAVGGPVFRYSQFSQQLPGFLDPERRFSPERAWWRILALAAAAWAVGHLLEQSRTYLAGLKTASHLFVPARFYEYLIVDPWVDLLIPLSFFELLRAMGQSWNLSIPISFDRPYGRTNLSEFWQHMNITVVSVFRDYMMYNRWGLRRSNVYLNVMLLFLACGLWHDTTRLWALWGLLHGVGFCIFLWNRKSGFIRLPDGSGTRAAGATLTYLYVCLCNYLPPRIVGIARGG